MNEKTVLDKTGLARLWMHIKVALNQMLTQAKESGEFNGEPGESVTVANVSESTADGGENVVTFSDGSILKVKNGFCGENGYSIYSNSTEPTINPDEGLEYSSTDADLLNARTGDFVLCTSNYTLYKIIGETAEAIFVQALCNLKGADGSTPVKGTDYFTDSDKQEIANLVDVTDWFGAGTSIPSGADLDTYTTEGKYHVSSTAISNTIVNAPITGTNYTLFVFVRTNGKSRTQMVITLSNKMFLRSATSTGTYGAWVEVGSASAPVRGEDYWTEEDKAEIKSYVDEAVAAGKTEPWVLDINMASSTTGTLSYYEEDGTQRTFTVQRKELTNNAVASLGTLLLELSYDELRAALGISNFTALTFYKDLITIMNAQDVVNITYNEPAQDVYESYNIQGKTYSYYLDELGSLSFAFGRTVIRLATTFYDQSSGSEEPE